MEASHHQYEFLDHTADVIVRAYGATIDAAFAAAAEGMFDVITNSAKLDGTGVISRDVLSIDQEGLLVAFLSDLIVIHEVEDVVLSHFEVAISSETALSFTARAEPFDARWHGEGTPVKGVSYHLMEIGIDPVRGCPYVQVLLDL